LWNRARKFINKTLTVVCCLLSGVCADFGQRTTAIEQRIINMLTERPYALSIAGFDPSGGAGLLADAKTFEANAVYGLGVVSALTYQNDIAFEKVEWTTPKKILRQLLVLRARFPLHYIKIGLVEDATVLQQIICFLHMNTPEAVIVWDPVLKASAGFSFHDQINLSRFDGILQMVTCLTPNKPEAQQLFGTDNLHDRLLEQSRYTTIYLKGGHDADAENATDILYYQQHSHSFSNPRLPKGEKHGSGCVLASALTAYLALGRDLPDAARLANAYTHRFLSSNDSLLGYHPFNQLL
jgi:hydroxymethylpyrimidine/phosphomethylpyrimidine kinase